MNAVLNLKINSKYISNNSPLIFDKKWYNTKSEYFDYFDNKVPKIFCKDFILFYFLMKSFSKKNLFFNDIKIFRLPIKKKTLSFLRAPYRYKVGKISLAFCRHKTMISLNKKVLINFYTVSEFLENIRLIQSLGNIVDSNFAKNNNSTFNVKLKMPYNYIYKNIY